MPETTRRLEPCEIHIEFQDWCEQCDHATCKVALTDAAQRIHELEAEVERQKALMLQQTLLGKSAIEDAMKAEAQLRDAHAEIATLEAKLRTYGQHKADCEGPCICGGKYTHADDVAIIDIFCPMCDGGKACTCGLIDPARTPDR